MLLSCKPLPIGASKPVWHPGEVSSSKSCISDSRIGECCTSTDDQPPGSLHRYQDISQSSVSAGIAGVVRQGRASRCKRVVAGIGITDTTLSAFRFETLSIGLYSRRGCRGWKSDKQHDAQHALLLRPVGAASTELLWGPSSICTQLTDDKEEAFGRR
jgi:hypothetical protein